ncbi:MAG TPA: TetR/AcrR family transcriptional regulator [Candidatus Eisenbacteria bacterium]|nr:TetR/AcrR family transcriptional regulator [Candidatus Eisenbacteria bacterium]
MDAITPQKPTTVRARLRLETHAAILDAAESVLAAEGLSGGRMEQIAERAGVAVGTMYNYFKCREALLQTLLESRRHDLFRRLDEALLAAGPSFQDQLHVFVDTTLGHVIAHRPLFALLVQEENAPIRARILPPPGERTFDLLTAKAEAIVALGLEQGLLRRQGAESWPLLLVSILRTMIVHELSSPARSEPHASGRLVAEFFLRGAGNRTHE